jgi:HSP20 family protein
VNGPVERVPALDVLDHEGHIEVRMDLPGVSPDDVNIEVKDGILTISAQVRTDETLDSGNYTYRERYTGSYQRSLRVPKTIDVQNAEAKFENGVLSLKMPKTPEAQPMRIPVKGAAVS